MTRRIASFATERMFGLKVAVRVEGLLGCAPVRLKASVRFKPLPLEAFLENLEEGWHHDPRGFADCVCTAPCKQGPWWSGYCSSLASCTPPSSST